jgi:sulfhydrogenase subunit beta (sulfur reductase)
MSQAYIISWRDFFNWLNSLTKAFDVLGPVKKKNGQVIFEQINNPECIDLNYCSTMLSPRQFIYPSRQALFQMNQKTGRCQTIMPERNKKKLIFAIHPCDMHAISILDRIFSGDFKDAYYKKQRQSSITIVLNCSRACDSGFCSSMATGPFLQLQDGFDVVLTAMTDNYLIEFGSKKGKEIVEKAKKLRRAAKENFAEKKQIEEQAKKSFTKQLDTKNLPELLMRNPEHQVYKQTADAKCLGCTNCTMVCPTCYCYNIEDSTDFDLKSTTRSRYWDSCQELNFAKVHEGNFRSSRQARLRQFVTHKLATWVEQYGCFGCVGCGRCMTWCPTGIDLTEIAKEIQQDAKAGKAE